MKSTLTKPNEVPPATGLKRLPIEMSDLLQVLTETVKDYAILLLDKDGNVLTWNGAAQRLTGWTEREIVGQHFSKFYPKEDVARGKTEMELKKAAEASRYEEEGWRVRKDGSRYWASAIITALRDKNGELLGYGKVTRDLTEKREAEQQLQRQAKELLEMTAVPVVQVWEGVVLVPLIGMLDSERTQRLMERLLQRVTDTGSPIAILDITGVPSVDTQTAQHLIETISAVRLLGSEVILTGVRPAIAQTLVHLGIDLSNVITRASLASGLRLALDSIEMKVVQKT